MSSIDPLPFARAMGDLADAALHVHDTETEREVRRLLDLPNATARLSVRARWARWFRRLLSGERTTAAS